MKILMLAPFCFKTTFVSKVDKFEMSPISASFIASQYHLLSRSHAYLHPFFSYGLICEAVYQMMFLQICAMNSHTYSYTVALLAAHANSSRSLSVVTAIASGLRNVQIRIILQGYICSI